MTDPTQSERLDLAADDGGRGLLTRQFLDDGMRSRGLSSLLGRNNPMSSANVASLMRKLLMRKESLREESLRRVIHRMCFLSTQVSSKELKLE